MSSATAIMSNGVESPSTVRRRALSMPSRQLSLDLRQALGNIDKLQPILSDVETPDLTDDCSGRSSSSRSSIVSSLTPLSVPYHRELASIRLLLSSDSSSCSQTTTMMTTTLPPFHYDEVLDVISRDSGNESSYLASIVDKTVPLLKQHINVLKRFDVSSVEETCRSMDGILYLSEQAWGLPVIGRTVAYTLCDVLNDEGGLNILLGNVADEDAVRAKTEDPKILLSLLILSQTMSVRNRQYVAQNVGTIESLVRIADVVKSDVDKWRTLLPGLTGVLECLFKESDETCRRLIHMGGLDIILYACRSFDNRVLRNCAAALANLAMYSTSETQREMASHKALDWLFPLAFFGDDTVSYYALIAITALAANVELEAAAIRSGTLRLVEPFVARHDPVEFGLKDKDHRHGQSDKWLRGLVPFLKLKSKWPEARILAAFHFAVEASIRKRQDKLYVFQEIGAVAPLKKVVLGKIKLASRLAAQALTIMGESVPRVLSPKVPLWTTEDVSCWVQQIRMSGEVSKRVEELFIDGDLLLQMNESDLVNDLAITDGIVRKRFIRELVILQRSADYTSCDETGLSNWLNEVSPDLRRYTYAMLKAGVNRTIVPGLLEKHLQQDCGITNGVHRLLIMDNAKTEPSRCNFDRVDNRSPETDQSRKNIDAFISYRRRNGKHLAGLLKVYLALHGLNVYLDIESLRTGRFDENLVTSIKRSTNFVLILTADALNNCIGDDQCNDWVHKEIAAALEGGCKIIPVIDQDFHWPEEKSLPEDIRDITKYQGIEWVHQWQDACISRLVDYIREGCNKPSPPVDSCTGRQLLLKISSRTSIDNGTISKDSRSPSSCPLSLANKLMSVPETSPLSRLQRSSSHDCDAGV